MTNEKPKTLAEMLDELIGEAEGFLVRELELDPNVLKEIKDKAQKLSKDSEELTDRGIDAGRQHGVDMMKSSMDAIIKGSHDYPSISQHEALHCVVAAQADLLHKLASALGGTLATLGCLNKREASEMARDICQMCASSMFETYLKTLPEMDELRRRHGNSEPLH